MELPLLMGSRFACSWSALSWDAASLLIPLGGLGAAAASLPRSANNPIITLCHTGAGDPHATCSAACPSSGPAARHRTPTSASAETFQWLYKSDVCLGQQNQNQNPQTGCEIHCLKVWDLTMASKTFILPSPSIFSPRNRFLSRRATCVPFQPNEVTLAMPESAQPGSLRGGS